MNTIFCVLLISNLFSFILYLIDKKKAIHHKNRISENSLLISSFLFGSLGSILSMLIFHHKTKKLKFKILVPLFLIIQILFIFKFKTEIFSNIFNLL